MFGLEETRVGPHHSPQLLKGGSSEVWASLFCCACREGMRENGLKLKQERFKFNIRKNALAAWVVRHWNGLPREVVESPSLEVFKSHLDLALGDVV